MAKERVYYLVNPSGTIHKVSREHARQRLASDPGYHMASAEEIKAYRQAQEEADEDGRRFVQRFDRPLGRQWNPDPDVAMEEAEEELGDAVIDESIDATKAARDLAEEYGIDLSEVEGSGLDDRIIKKDVAAVAEAQEAEDEGGDEEADGDEE